MLTDQPKFIRRLGGLSAFLSLLTLITIVWLEGYTESEGTFMVLAYVLISVGLLCSTLFHVVVAYKAVRRWTRFKKLIPDWVILASAVGALMATADGLAVILAFVHQLISMTRWFGMTARGKSAVQQDRDYDEAWTHSAARSLRRRRWTKEREQRSR